VTLADDNGTPGEPSDDFDVALSGLSDIDGGGTSDDLAASAAAQGEAALCVTGDVTNTATATGKGQNGTYVGMGSATVQGAADGVCAGSGAGGAGGGSGVGGAGVGGSGVGGAGGIGGEGGAGGGGIGGEGGAGGSSSGMGGGSSGIGGAGVGGMGASSSGAGGAGASGSTGTSSSSGNGGQDSAGAGGTPDPGETGDCRCSTVGSPKRTHAGALLVIAAALTLGARSRRRAIARAESTRAGRPHRC
jgi:hypothetical protein